LTAKIDVVLDRINIQATAAVSLAGVNFAEGEGGSNSSFDKQKQPLCFMESTCRLVQQFSCRCDSNRRLAIEALTAKIAVVLYDEVVVHVGGAAVFRQL
jgi:hypothetical protein